MANHSQLGFRAHAPWSGFFASFALVLAVSACGPSVRTLVESDMRFEHCYRLDEDRQVSFDDKRACWAAWTQRHARGQDRARVSYARDRLRALDVPVGAVTYWPATSSMAAPVPPPGPVPTATSGPASTAPNGSPTSPAPSPTAPSPATPYAPPPTTAPAPVSPYAPPPPTAPLTYSGPCNGDCAAGFRQCVTPCGAESSCMASCDRSYRTCLRACQ